MKGKNYFKVVGGRGGEFFSAAIFGERSLLYRIGQVTKPTVPSPIFAFETLEAARLYSSTHTVLRGVGKPYEGKPKTCVPPPRVAESLNSTAFARFWRGEDWPDSDLYLTVPEGTVFLSEFTPEEVVS